MVDIVISQIILLKNIDNFSAVEIRTAYLAIKGDQKLSPPEARRFVYEELQKIVKRGWLKKMTSEKKGITRYSKTKHFNYEFFNNITINKTPVQSSPTSANAFNLAMHSRLENYQKELLEGLGAIDELISLRKIYPELWASLKSKYQSLREHNHMLMGKINTIEEILAAHRDKL
jgi:hypothetical protein